MRNLKSIQPTIERKGVAVNPQGHRQEEGVLNPASARDRSGNLILFTRSVAKGNNSCIEMLKRISQGNDEFQTENIGIALEAEAWYELNGNCGQGCEDPRVTFIPLLDRYVMCYTGYSQQGPRVCIAISKDAFNWDRLGIATFPAKLKLHLDDKDAFFFPEPVLSPRGVLSLAMMHRPMVHVPMSGHMSEIESVLAERPSKRQSIRIAYVPLDAVLADIQNITTFQESRRVMSPAGNWGLVKLGGGTPPVRIAEGWLTLYHGVDAVAKADGKFAMRYSAGLAIHDATQPHKILYRSSEPLFVPETEEELMGIVNDVVFPTGIDQVGEREFEVLYGMADFRIGRLLLKLK